MVKKYEIMNHPRNFKLSLYQLPLQLLKWLFSGILELFKIGVWLLIQILELGVWLASELSQFLKQIRHQLKKTIQTNQKAVFTWPIKQILRGIWSIIVVFFWLLIQLIELGVWVLSKFREWLSQTPQSSLQGAEEEFLPPSVKLRRQMKQELQAKNETPPASNLSSRQDSQKKS